MFTANSLIRYPQSSIVKGLKLLGYHIPGLCFGLALMEARRKLLYVRNNGATQEMQEFEQFIEKTSQLLMDLAIQSRTPNALSPQEANACEKFSAYVQQMHIQPFHQYSVLLKYGTPLPQTHRLQNGTELILLDDDIYAHKIPYIPLSKNHLYTIIENLSNMGCALSCQFHIPGHTVYFAVHGTQYEFYDPNGYLVLISQDISEFMAILFESIDSYYNNTRIFCTYEKMYILAFDFFYLKECLSDSLVDERIIPWDQIAQSMKCCYSGSSWSYLDQGAIEQIACRPFDMANLLELVGYNHPLFFFVASLDDMPLKEEIVSGFINEYKGSQALKSHSHLRLKLMTQAEYRQETKIELVHLYADDILQDMIRISLERGGPLKGYISSVVDPDDILKHLGNLIDTGLYSAATIGKFIYSIYDKLTSTHFLFPEMIFKYCKYLNEEHFAAIVLHAGLQLHLYDTKSINFLDDPNDPAQVKENKICLLSEGQLSYVISTYLAFSFQNHMQFNQNYAEWRVTYYKWSKVHNKIAINNKGGHHNFLHEEIEIVQKLVAYQLITQEDWDVAMNQLEHDFPDYQPAFAQSLEEVIMQTQIMKNLIDDMHTAAVALECQMLQRGCQSDQGHHLDTQNDTPQYSGFDSIDHNL